MEKIGLCLDTTSQTRDDFKNYEFIKFAPLGVSVDNVLYQEPDLSFDEMMGYLKEGRKMTTSQPSPGEFLQLFHEYHNEGYTHVMVITLSEQISGTYQSATIAKSMIDFPLTVSVHSPKVASYGVALGAIELANSIQNGISFTDLELKYENVFEHAHVMFTLANLMHLFRGGRLNRVSALLGTVLRIKPIVEMVDGKLQLTKKERTNLACFNEFMAVIDNYVATYQTVSVDIVELNRLEWAEKLKQAIQEKYPTIAIHMTHQISPVFLVHLGDQGFGISLIGF